MHAVLVGLVVLAILVAALIAQTLIGNGAMLAIILVPLAAYLAVRLTHGNPRARSH